MTYFTNFPKIKSTINDKSIGMVDISFGLAYDPEVFSTSSTEMGTFRQIGNLSAKIYDKDANKFWGLMFANEQINPWTFLQETPSDYIQANKNYTAFYSKYTSGGKLNPNSYLQLQSSDIIVKGTYNSGYTAAESMFSDYDTYFNSYGTNLVANGYGDTKKAQISQTIGSTASSDLTNINNVAGTFGLVILRKGSTGYYLANNPTIGGGSISNLKSYGYLDSAAYFLNNASESIASPTPLINIYDSIQTVVSGDDENPASVIIYEQQYTPISTKDVYVKTYTATSTVKYLKNSDLGTIVKKLI